ncbi:hypothetical protein N7G274_002820 [Stereocaulon virgatum]|uniref:NWD NACHT-NTPase N-terminal domain-containing protein n=1 Tax=Stereocaulon virgatum TaxID=373712 RepID=A0ABR4AIQ8_9LECA
MKLKSKRLSILPGRSFTGSLVNNSLDFAENHVDERLHPGLSHAGIGYNSEIEEYSAEPEEIEYFQGHEDFEANKALLDCREAFLVALKNYVKGADARYRSKVNLMDEHTWSDVMREVEIARDEYKGVGEKGIMPLIRKGWQSFTAAAPAITAWLQLLPNNTLYGSVLCGGLTIILEAVVRLGELRQDTFEAIDQIPLRIQRAQFFVRTYDSASMEDQAAKLYQAIIDALQHILTWYKRKTGVKFFSAFAKGAAYATVLKTKMQNVEAASQSINDVAGLGQHTRLSEIRNLSWLTKRQLSTVEKRTEELMELQLEARNHLYAFFRDNEAWREASQGWMKFQQEEKSRKARRTQSKLGEKGRNLVVRETLLLALSHDSDALARDVEDPLCQLSTLPLADQDRAAAIIGHPDVDKWLTECESGAILVHGNCRRHDGICPTSVVSALLVSIFSKMPTFITLYWFCGSHIREPDGNALGMMRSLICQLLNLSDFDFEVEKEHKFDGKDLPKLLSLFKNLLQQLPNEFGVVCVIDAISYYEDMSKCEDTCETISKMLKYMKVEAPILKIFITSPTRTGRINHNSSILKRLLVIDIPTNVNGRKQGFNHRLTVASTEEKVWKLHEDLERGENGI